MGEHDPQAGLLRQETPSCGPTWDCACLGYSGALCLEVFGKGHSPLWGVSPRKSTVSQILVGLT